MNDEIEKEEAMRRGDSIATYENKYIYRSKLVCLVSDGDQNFWLIKRKKYIQVHIFVNKLA